jgi:penicillin-binding protein 1C
MGKYMFLDEMHRRIKDKLKDKLSARKWGVAKKMAGRNKKWGAVLGAILGLFLFFFFSLPANLFETEYSPVLYDRNGRLLGAMVSSDGQWRFPAGDLLNEKFKMAIVEAEDKRFFYHRGIDLAAIGRAAQANMRSGKIVSGASTITMQTIRLARTEKARRRGKILSRSFGEKAIEAFLALRLEAGMSKSEILSLYAANAPFGGNVVGLEAAVWRWFGHGSADLSWAEAATLAVLPNNPAIVNPGRNRGALQAKRDELLSRLCQKKYFDSATLSLAEAEPLPEAPLPLPRLAPHLLVRLTQEMKASNEPRKTARFSTTIDASVQSRVALLVQRRSAAFSASGIMNAACIVLDTKSGATLAYVGNVLGGDEGSDSKNGYDVDIITSQRSSGSTLKPFLYAAMLDSGELLPDMLISDIPTRVGSYSPENNTRNYLGVVPASQALARSLNIPAVRELRSFGVARFAVLLRSLGLSTLFRDNDDYGLPLILGGAETTLWELSGIYAGLGRTASLRSDGKAKNAESLFYPPFVLRHSSDTAGNTRDGQSVGDFLGARHPSRGLRSAPISSGAAWLALDALMFSSRPAEEAAWQEYSGARRIAWKTGTSQGNRDAWCMGVSADWTVGVWVGNTSGEGRAELRSATTAAPLMFEIFQALSADSAWIAPDFSALKIVDVCGLSGYPAGPDCATISTSLAPIGAPAAPPCPYCRAVVLAADGSLAVLEKDSTLAVAEQKWFVLPPAEEWYYRKWNLNYKPLPLASAQGPQGQTSSSGASSSSSSLTGGAVNSGVPFALFNPEQGAQIYIPKEMSGREGRVVFVATHREADAVIHWHLDANYMGETSAFHEMSVRPAAGRHRLTLVDNHGNTLVRTFEVLSEM